jgi:O-antigen biosynthesis protein
MRIGQTSSPTLVADPPTRVTYRFTMPPRAAFRSYIALIADGWDRGPGAVDFSVSVSATNGRQSIQRTWRIDPAHLPRHRRWVKRRASLARFARQEVELTLSTSAASEASANSGRAVWGDPAIVARKRARDIWSLWVTSLRVHGARGILSRLRRGAAAGLPTAATSPTSSRSFLEHTWKQKLKLFLSDPSSSLVFPAVPDPLVSILIPTFNKGAYLYQCLESVLAHTDVPFEVIVVDDCSEDETAELLQRLRHVTWARNDENLEFIRTCNRAIGLARGRYLLFLNNDVTVTPRWLSLLVETMERYPRCGAVQGKLVRPEGTLQEAGTIIWRDGSALGYGRDDDPLRPEYSYLREVDYCSAACLLVRAELVHKLGGFDERYIPAYYEDVDLCFGVRHLEHTVVFQPQVSVFHYEYGSRSDQRARALCAANRPKFAEKWALALQGHYPYGEVLRGRDRRQGTRILVMDDQIPSPDLGSGFPRAYRMLHLLVESGFIVTFVPMTLTTPHQPATQRLQQLGIEVFYGETFRVEDLLRERAGGYDVVLVSRPHNGAAILPRVRQYFPRARIAYDAEALFCVRDFLQAEFEGRSVSDAVKQTMLRRELEIVNHADVVITVSQSERDMILAETAHPNVVVCGHACDVHRPTTPFSRRQDLLFVGGFLQGHPPNIDAVSYFATTLFPRIRQSLPECRLVVVGRHPPARIRQLASEHIIVAGYVADLTEYYERCRAFVVPLRFGAGISLKLLEAMSYGTPAVTSSLGAKGLSLRDGREALIAQSDDQFVEKVVQLYQDEGVWSTVQRAGQEYIARHCSPESVRRTLSDALSTTGASGER